VARGVDFVPRGGRQAGFTLVEVLLVMAGIAMASAVVVPQISTLVETQRARNAARTVERQLQTARLKAVTNSRALRVRFNCPAAGQLRVLEVTGLAATDNATNRCSPTAYPYPPPIDALRATPSLDSPVVYLPPGTSVTGSALVLEFGPKGNVYSVNTSTNVVTPLAGDVVLTVTKGGYAATVTINALGRVQYN
jgi:prepilin-type N-terminal cleavage/methylation domain-containing protein